MADRLFACTRKGLMVFKRKGTAWTLAATHFLGSPVAMVLPGSKGKTVVVALDLGHFGIKVHRTDDGGKTWKEQAAPAFPKLDKADPKTGEGDPDAPAVKGVWSLEWGRPGKTAEIWCGAAPAGLFRSADGGKSWSLVESLWNSPERRRWFGGGTVNTALHSICVDPRDPRRVAVAVSCGGVSLTEDGGKTWRVASHGMRAEYMPPDQAGDPVVQDPHMMVQCPKAPGVWWVQHHNGIFRSTDDLASWHEIKTAPVSKFGFAVAVHPKKPGTAWFAPAVKDEHRYPVDGKVVVQRTDDGGKTFKVQRKGLPQGNAYDLVYRHGLAVDETGNRLAMASTTGALWTSANGGNSWKLVSAHLPPVYGVKFA